MGNRRGRPRFERNKHGYVRTPAMIDHKRRIDRRKYKSEKYRHFEAVLIATGLWKPGKVERT